MDAQAWLAERTPAVNAALEAWLPGADVAPSALHAAMRHLVFPGGKRLRPALALAAAEAVGGPAQAALPMATAVELVHIYSLVHDDLPCMDDDELRRGRPTVHVAFDEATAVLAGDALQSLAFEVLLSAPEPGPAVRAARDLAEAIGAAGLVGGQADDLGPDPGALGVDHILSIHARKTAALIRVAILGGARLAGANDSRLAELAAFGSEVGVAFQIADDCLDAEDEDSCSLLAVEGIDASRERAEKLLESALGRLEGAGEGAEPLRALARFAVRRDL
ncbi:MAG: polyprenyl synthetase family protein [Myxococcota bacterium]|jgi:geranylgeranyl pyrophosphate synthase|nr:polyprenyl synthetase family protein [Myxococcota bacterium]